MRALRLGVLGSGKGSNCRAILAKIRSGELAAEVRLVVADAPNAGILDVAREFDVPSAVLPAGPWRTKLDPAAEAELVRLLHSAEVELVVLAGFMRILKAPVLDAFAGRIINIHPSLLPRFPGKDAWAQALEARASVTGCTVHFVDSGIDTGEIIAQREVEILPNDTASSLHARIQLAERELFPEVIAQFAANWRSRSS